MSQALTPGAARRDGRTLLLALGLGEFNTTMVIQWLWVAPATTDPKSQPIILMVAGIQKQLGLPMSGYIDQPTASALRRLIGPGWMHLPWATVVEAVLAGGRAPAPVSTGRTKFVKDPHMARSMEGLGEMPFGLPDVPGGILTYGVAAYLLYRHLKKKPRGAALETADRVAAGERRRAVEKARDPARYARMYED